MGLMEYDSEKRFGDYVIGRKPPKHWIEPFAPPKDYKHIISFSNGYHIMLLSFERPELFRGVSLDSLDLDESALIPKDKLDEALIPTVRGNIHKLVHNHHLHHSICDFSSSPWLPQGQWIFETEDLAKKYPDEYFFLAATAIDNFDVLGMDYFKRQAKIMTKLKFDVEILNKRLKKVENCFYPSFRTIHIDHNVYNYKQQDEGLDKVEGYIDYSPNMPIELSFDFNAAFMSCIVSQFKYAENQLRFIDELFVKHSTIERLIGKFISNYQTHTNKMVHIYGDRNGFEVDKVSGQIFYETIQRRLLEHGWYSEIKAIPSNIEHKTKYSLINYGLSESSQTLPRVRINQFNCGNLIASIYNSPVNDDFTKDKTSESKDGIEQELATHLSDAFDYRVYMLWAKQSGVSTSQSGEVGFM